VPTSESVTEILWEGTAQTVREATDAWKDEEEGAARANAAEAILRIALDLIYLAERMIARQWDNLFSQRIRNVEAMGDCLQRCALKTIDLARGTHELVGFAEAQGYKFEQTPELLAGIGRLSAMKDRLARHWPRFDPDRLERGLAQAARGEFVDPEEIYREFPELQDKGGP
jgi:hypothetical protein